MYIDASFSSHPGGAGHSAMVTFVGTTATILRSSKQKIGTKSSTEAELVALSDLYLVGLWLHAFLKSLGVALKTPIIYQDNKSAIALVQSLLNKKLRSRHLNARRRVMYDEIMVNRSVDIAYLQTSEMTADVLSKPVCGEKFFQVRGEHTGRRASYEKLKKTQITGRSPWRNLPYGDRGACILCIMERVRTRAMSSP